MDTAHSFPPPPADPVDPTADSAESGASFWTGAPKLLAAFATILGSIVALTTVLVQAGVIGSQTPAQTTATVPVQPVSVRTAPQTTPTVPPAAETPTLDRALGDLNGSSPSRRAPRATSGS